MALNRVWVRLLLFAIGAAACVLVYLFLLNFPPISVGSRSAGIIPVFVLAAGTVLLTAYFLRTEELSWHVLGLARGDRRGSRFTFGFLGGLALIAIWVLILDWVTGTSWRVNPAFSGIALATAGAFYLFNNIGEELVYRGYAFFKLAERGGEIFALLFTTTIFALLHLQKGIPWQGVIAAVFTTGLIYGAIFARWRSVPLALGFHVATNVGQDVFGLRPGADSWIVPTLASGVGDAQVALLSGIAVINIIVAASIMFISRGAPTR
jgi:membrane protease YdiL (CAAX protease family)